MTASTRLSDEDRQLVSAAVCKAEASSAGEIVTIIADRSDSYGDIAALWATFAALASLAALTLAPDFYLSLYDRMMGNWAPRWQPGDVFALALLVATLKFLGVWLVMLWPPLRVFLTPPSIRHARVRARAVAAFRIGAERRTHGRTGILIYLSMREHRAEIVADDAIAAKVAPEAWGEAMIAMIVHIREGRIGEGMAAAVEKVGAVLAEHFPRAEDDRNELPDRLIEV